LWCKFRARRRLGLGVSTCYAWLRRDLAQADDDQFTSFYERHLRSKPWKALRERALRRAGSRCESPQCSSSVSIGVEVHHLTYERLGHERLSDVIVLCRPCHREHGHKLHARARGATGQ
jgi:5-methylcytosine-specific restriction endonuclease McrA